MDNTQSSPLSPISELRSMLGTHSCVAHSKRLRELANAVDQQLKDRKIQLEAAEHRLAIAQREIKSLQGQCAKVHSVFDSVIPHEPSSDYGVVDRANHVTQLLAAERIGREAERAETMKAGLMLTRIQAHLDRAALTPNALVDTRVGEAVQALLALRRDRQAALDLARRMVPDAPDYAGVLDILRVLVERMDENHKIVDEAGVAPGDSNTRLSERLKTWLARDRNTTEALKIAAQEANDVKAQHAALARLHEETHKLLDAASFTAGSMADRVRAAIDRGDYYKGRYDRMKTNPVAPAGAPAKLVVAPYMLKIEFRTSTILLEVSRAELTALAGACLGAARLKDEGDRTEIELSGDRGSKRTKVTTSQAYGTFDVERDAPGKATS